MDSRKRPGSGRDQLLAELERLRERVAALEQVEAQRQQLEEALRRSEERFRALIENSADAISLAGADGRILYVSPCIRQILGYAPEELVGRYGLELVHPDDREGVASAFAELLAGRDRSIIAELRARRKNGSWCWLEIVGTNLLNEPRVRAIAAHYRDITARKQGEETLRQTVRDEARLEGITLAARELADRLNNNLAVGLGTIELIEQRVALPDDLARLARSAQHCLNAAVLDIAKLQRVVRVETKDTVVGEVLDLDRSFE
jgi:PAS domain S-box-containing protein